MIADCSIKIPTGLLQILEFIPFVIRASDVLHYVTQVVIQTLRLDKVDGLDPADLVVRRVINYVLR